jgi:23S rRNA (cytosine1962-C5)-methyltransferase
VVCDRYGAHAVVRLDGRGVLRWRELLVAVLRQEAAAQGLELRGVLLEHGRRGARTVEAVAGTVPDEPVPVREHGMLLFADLRRGQKTGLFLDHRDSRRAVRELSSGLAVLDLYGYSGSFSVAAGLGGAQEALTVDRSEAALALAARAWRGNDLDPARHEVLATDVPRWLETGVGAERRWDLVVADPPSFAPSADAVPAALAGYARLHAGCLARVRDGGLYLAASCSSHVDRPAFEETLRRGAAGARRVIQVLGRWGAAPDHPRLLAFPEGDYLKVVLCRVGR